MIKGLKAMLGVAALAAPVAAKAQSETAGLEVFTRTPFYGQLVAHTLASVPADVFRPCPTLATRGTRITILKPMAFAKDGFPTAGIWKQTIPVSGCGADITLNVYFAATPDEKINSLVAAPGDTHADAVIQADALTSAKAALAAAHLDCASADVKDTHFEAYGLIHPPTADPGPGHPDRPWWETWTLIGCGHSVRVPLDFLPAATGTRVIQPGGVSAG
jgi:hypothetical protein